MIHQANGGRWTRHYDYAADSNRLLATSLPGDDPSGPFTGRYDYNSHGSMAQMPHLPLITWDFAECLQASSGQVVNAGAPETTYYVYDAAGQRMRKVTERQAAEGGASTRKNERIYLGEYELYREYNGDGATVDLERETLHIMDDKQRIALVETRTLGDDGSASQLVRYQLGNHLGSAGVELDGAGRLISYEEYFPYGATSYQAVDAGVRAAAKRYRYTGMERDEQTALACHGARYYVPWLGRWNSVDRDQSYHAYSYSLDCPTMYVDPDGRAPTYPPSSMWLGAQSWLNETAENAKRNIGTLAQFASDMGVVSSLAEMAIGSPLDLVPSQSFQEGRPLGRDIATVVGIAEAEVGVVVFAAGFAIEASGVGGGAAFGSVFGPVGTGEGAAAGGVLALPVAGTLMAVGGGMTLHGGAVAGANFMNGPVDPKNDGMGSTSPLRHEPPRPDEGPWRTAKGGFKNQYDDLLKEELEAFAEHGGRVYKPGDHGFRELLESGEEIKWGISEETGELLIVPKWIDEYEVPHSMLAEGKPLTAAGEANIREGWISNHSGHYIPDNESLNLGLNAFYREVNVTFWTTLQGGG
jgi:RHS repeat-associated protein